MQSTDLLHLRHHLNRPEGLSLKCWAEQFDTLTTDTVLLEESLRFARQAGYTRMILWTTDVLSDARRLYQKAGFQLLEEERVQSFGKELGSQVWGRDL